VSRHHFGGGGHGHHQNHTIHALTPGIDDQPGLTLELQSEDFSLSPSGKVGRG
jgi:hypothetical protein